MEIQEIKEELKLRITQGINYVIEAIDEILDNSSDLYNSFIILKSKYNDLMHFSTINTLPYRELEVAFDNLRNSLLRLIDEIDAIDTKKNAVEKEPQNKSLPHRRTNFFQLLTIHHQNLEAIVYVEQLFNSSLKKYEYTRVRGREAMFKIYDNLQFQYKRKYEEDTAENIVAYFNDYFLHEIGMIEVYLKNIKHILNYINEVEIDRRFFIDTLKSLLSRFELSMIFYYVITSLDPEFRELAKNTQLFDGLRRDTLLNPDHFSIYQPD